MKRCFACACVWLLSIGCNSSDPNSGTPNKGGASGSAGSPAAQAGGGSSNLGGGGASAGGVGNGAAGNGAAGGLVGGAGSANVAGSAGNPASGGSTGSAGNPGAAGSGGGAGAATGGFKCPPGPFTFAPPTGMASKVAGTPPTDAFNKDAWTNVEGPVWIGDSLYFSEMTNSNMRPPSRILKIASGGAVSVFAADAGSNGLAVDGSGNLIAALHKDGSISQLSLTGGAATPLVSMYMSKPFTSPNDLAIRSDGTIYFSDPSYQNSANPQGAERLYRVTPPPTRTVSAIADAPTPPNGVTLSPDEKTLYVAANNAGLKKFTVMTDGSLSAASDFVAGSGGDGMAVDCAGDLFVTGNGAATVRVYSPAGALLTTIQLAGGAGNTTNVAFGGADRKTLYITAQGTEGQRGVYSIALSVPGFPY
jgi:gluconolactonase